MKKNLPYLITLIIFAGVIYFLSFIGEPLNRTGAEVLGFVKNMYHSQEFREQYEKISKENLLLQDRLVAMDDTEKENVFLRKRLNIYKEEAEPFHFVLASLIGRGSSFGEDTIIINKGIKDGLKGNEIVIINPNIVAGKVDNVFKNRAIVRLLSDKYIEIKVKTLTGTQGVLRGDMGNTSILEEVLQSSSLEKGDILVTDIDTPLTPANLLVGKVVNIASKPSDISKRALVTSFFEKERLENVFVIIE